MKHLAICPLKIELKALIQKAKQLGYVITKCQVGALDAWLIRELSIVFAVGGQGKAQFAVQTQHLISYLPDLCSVFCVGSSGALTSKVSMFDVVIGSKTVEHDYKSLFLRRRPPEFFGDETLIKKISHNDFLNFNIHLGIIASGDEDITHFTRAEEIRKATKALVVAWEGAGGARACKFNKIPFVELRAVTDLANQQTPHSFKQNVDAAMANIYDALLAALA